MSYLILKPKTKKEETFLKELADKLNVEYQSVSLKDYMSDIADSRKQIKQGKKVSLSSLANGL
jgi:uncharacterized membrane protein YebE (DUF533 family)